MLMILFTQDSETEDVFCGASSMPEPSLFFSYNLLILGFGPVQDDLQHNFSWMTEEADGSAV